MFLEQTYLTNPASISGKYKTSLLIDNIDLMSRISNSLDVDKLYNGSPSIIPHEEEVLPSFQNCLSPLLDESQFFWVPLVADECQQDKVGRITNMPLPRVSINTNTATEISTKTPTKGTKTHQDNSMLIRYSSELKKSTMNKGSKARRSGKKDRHTKIETANGLRDRRMRLSLQIARKFFDLQDRLGFDKASKTIEWLFTKSEKAITQLSSEASYVTQVNDNNFCQKGSKSIEISEEQRNKTTSDQGDCLSGTQKTQKSATSRNTKHIAKYLRDEARARARERTREKKTIRCLEKAKWSLSDQAYRHLTQLGPAENPNPLFEIGQESMSNTSSQDNISTSQSSLHHNLANMELLGATASPSRSVSCSMFSYDHEKNGDLLLGGLDSYSSNLFDLGWNISSECLNLNSVDFLDNSV